MAVETNRITRGEGLKHTNKCICPECYISQNTRTAFDRWWKNEMPVSCNVLNHYDSYHRLYYAALYGFNAGRTKSYGS